MINYCYIEVCSMEQILVDCCIKFLIFIKNLKDIGIITQVEYDEMAKLKIEFLSSLGFSTKKLLPNIYP